MAFDPRLASGADTYKHRYFAELGRRLALADQLKSHVETIDRLRSEIDDLKAVMPTNGVHGNKVKSHREPKPIVKPQPTKAIPIKPRSEQKALPAKPTTTKALQAKPKPNRDLIPIKSQSTVSGTPDEDRPPTDDLVIDSLIRWSKALHCRKADMKTEQEAEVVSLLWGFLVERLGSTLAGRCYIGSLLAVPEYLADDFHSLFNRQMDAGRLKTMASNPVTNFNESVWVGVVRQRYPEFVPTALTDKFVADFARDYRIQEMNRRTGYAVPSAFTDIFFEELEKFSKDKGIVLDEVEGGWKGAKGVERMAKPKVVDSETESELSSADDSDDFVTPTNKRKISPTVQPGKRGRGRPPKINKSAPVESVENPPVMVKMAPPSPIKHVEPLIKADVFKAPITVSTKTEDVEMEESEDEWETPADNGRG